MMKTSAFIYYVFLVTIAAPRYFLSLVAADCFTSTTDMLIAQIGGKRELIICPDTTIDIGVPTDATFANFDNGDVPLSAIANDVTFKCGDNGSSNNNCILNGGFIQFATTPEIPQAPGLSISTNNLFIQGVTFTGQLATDLGVGGEASVGISAPGTNIILDDVIFDDLTGGTILFASRNALTSPEAFPPMSANVTIQNSVFRNLTYTNSVILNVNQSVALNNVIFEDITHVPCDECPGAIASIVYGRDGSTEIVDCEFNNVEFTHSAVFIRGEESEFTYSGNTGTGLIIANNEINDEKTCSDGLIISSSPFGSSLNLTEELDSCNRLLDEEAAAVKKDAAAATAVYYYGKANTFIASMLINVVVATAMSIIVVA